MGLSGLVVSLGLLLCGGAPAGAPADAAAPPSPPASGALSAILGAGHPPAAAPGDDFLPVEQAFRLYAVMEGPDKIRLNWQIADGYYLYRARIKVVTPGTAVQLGRLELPAGQVKTDEYFGRQIVYHHEINARLPLRRERGAPAELPLRVTYQGCAEAGLCYPPVTRDLTLRLPASGATAADSR